MEFEFEFDLNTHTRSKYGKVIKDNLFIRNEKFIDQVERLISKYNIGFISIGRHYAAFDESTCAPIVNSTKNEVIWETYNTAIVHVAKCIKGKSNDLYVNGKLLNEVYKGRI